MNLTFWNWFLVGFLALVGLVATIGIGVSYFNDYDTSYTGTQTSYGYHHKCRILGFLVSGAISLIVVFGTIFLFNWYHTSFASGIRSYKDFKSDISNGLYREITITNEDGKTIYNYTGKCDIQEQDTIDERKLKFENQEGKRVIIYFGITDTVKIIEKK